MFFLLLAEGGELQTANPGCQTTEGTVFRKLGDIVGGHFFGNTGNFIKKIFQDAKTDKGKNEYSEKKIRQVLILQYLILDAEEDKP